jgi:transcriptional regulator with XRE-family HTH domain
MPRRGKNHTISLVSADEFIVRRKALRMKAKDVADAFDVSRAYISRIENGKSPVTRLLEYALTGLEYERGVNVVLYVPPSQPRPTQN